VILPLEAHILASRVDGNCPGDTNSHMEAYWYGNLAKLSSTVSKLLDPYYHKPNFSHKRHCRSHHRLSQIYVTCPKIIINVNKRVCCGKNKRWQTLVINVDIFILTVCKFCSEYFCSSCKFEIPVRWCSSQQNLFPNSYYRINLRESLSVLWISEYQYVWISQFRYQSSL